jgi:hypothetical protein
MDATNWIDIIRTGSLFKQGDGPLTIQVESNKDELFGGCPTTARTGRVTVREEGTEREGVLEVVQQGATQPFQPPAACTVAPIPYGTTTAGSLTSSDCRVGGVPTKYYTFQGFADQQIRITMTAGRSVSSGLQVALIRLYGPSSGFIVGHGGNVVIENPRIDRRLFCGGTFTLEVRSAALGSVFNETGLGNYTLSLVSQN